MVAGVLLTYGAVQTRLFILVLTLGSAAYLNMFHLSLCTPIRAIARDLVSETLKACPETTLLRRQRDDNHVPEQPSIRHVSLFSASKHFNPPINPSRASPSAQHPLMCSFPASIAAPNPHTFFPSPSAFVFSSTSTSSSSSSPPSPPPSPLPLPGPNPNPNPPAIPAIPTATHILFIKAPS